MNEQKIREEFINHPELAGTNGYCNPEMAQKIVNFFLERCVSKEEVDRLKHDHEILVNTILEGYVSKESVRKYCNDNQFVDTAQAGQFAMHSDGYNQALEDLLSSDLLK